MKLDLSNLIEIPSRSRLAAQTKSTPADTSEEDKLGKTLLRQMQELQQGVKTMNVFTRSAKQAATSKAGMLKQRLEMLKEMLLHASPEAAKSLARELKSIAHELASLAKSVGGSSSSSAATTENTPANSVSETPPAETDAAQIEAASKDLDSETASPEAAATSKETAQASDKKSGTSLESADHDGDDDEALRAILLKAKKLLKEVINQLKAKMALGDKETKHDVEAAEKSLAKLDESLSGGSQSSFYTASGISAVASMSSGLSVTTGLSGISIDLNA